MKKQEIATPIKPKPGEVNGKIADSQATKRKKYGGESKTCVIVWYLIKDRPTSHTIILKMNDDAFTFKDTIYNKYHSRNALLFSIENGVN